MKLHAMEFPDDPARWPGWLEQYLTGLDLAALVAELEAVHGPPSDPVPSVREWLGERLGAVLEGGLRTLPSGMLGRLLRQPRLLLELQELVLTSGGAYWDRVAPASGASTPTSIASGRDWRHSWPVKVRGTRRIEARHPGRCGSPGIAGPGSSAWPRPRRCSRCCSRTTASSPAPPAVRSPRRADGAGAGPTPCPETCRPPPTSTGLPTRPRTGSGPDPRSRSRWRGGLPSSVRAARS